MKEEQRIPGREQKHINILIRERFYGKVTFEQRPEGDKRISSADGLGGEFSCRDNSISKGPEADTLGETVEMRGGHSE